MHLLAKRLPSHARAFIKDLEKIRPSTIIDIIHSGENLKFKTDIKEKMPTAAKCTRCGYISSMEVCKACLLLEGLNKGLPKLGIGKSTTKSRQLPLVSNSQSQDDSIRSKEGSSCGSCKCKSTTNSSIENGGTEDMKISANGDVQTETANTGEGKVDILNAMKNLDF